MFSWIAHLSKKQTFVMIIGVIVAVSVIGSSLYDVVTSRSDDDAVRIAVVGPMTGDSSGIGRSLRQGVQLYIDIANENGGFNGVDLAVDVHDDENKPETARIVADKIATSRAEAVIGHWTADTVAATQKTYEQANLQLIVPASIHPDVIKNSKSSVSALFNESRQARFLANYARNVLGHKLVSMIVDKRAYGDTMARNFEETYKRFGTKIRYTWEFESGENSVRGLQRIVAELKEKKDAGALFLAVNEIDGARLMKMMRDAGIRNLVVGPTAFATNAFNDMIAKLPGKNQDPGHYTNKMMVTAPLLFDTANETAQNFKNRYIEQFGEVPDWVAAYAYDSAHLAVNALRETVEEGEIEGAEVARRESIGLDLAGRTKAEDGVQGVTGLTYFDFDGQAQKPVFVGVYSGPDIVSALTQLQPIKPGGNQNYIAELKRGRVLYVNDRFMYKTNVVYTGLQVKEISEVNYEENVYDMNLLIWFRYRGSFEPQDMKILNAAEPLELGKPIAERMVGDMTYQLYEVKGKFRFNFSKTQRVYGEQLTGISFSHNKLNKNNLQYVVDVLGVGLGSGETMRDKLEKSNALNPSTGWVVERAWISQDIVPESTLGNPTYVGFGSDDPDYSQIDLGIIIKRGEFVVRDVIPAEFFIYIWIFGFTGTVFALVMDRRERGRFWAAQSWFLRLVAWPALLLSSGNLLLDFAVLNIAEHNIDSIILGYEFLWWLVPARIGGIALERFLWLPLEDHTERAIPNVIRVFGSVVIYTFAACGIIAFVFEQHLTSLLATGGLMSLIIGLAVQANISNIFSGIVINMERPFNVGDWVKIGDTDEGRVVDITWRTTRVKVRNGYVVSIPNGQVSESQIHNFNSFDAVRMEVPVFLDARYPVNQLVEWMETGIAKAPGILDAPDREVRFKGVVWDFGWVAEFEVQYWLDNYGRKEEITEAALTCLWNELAMHGVRSSGYDAGAPTVEGQFVEPALLVDGTSGKPERAG